MSTEVEYSKYYNIENYLFGEVASSFADKGYLSAIDFFSIVIWKANRSKSKIAKKFECKNLDEEVKRLTGSIYRLKTSKEKLSLLINDYQFRLPMASAILSVLYQDEFSVYDVRVCDMLQNKYGTRKYHIILNWKFDRLWKGYIEYLSKVKELSGKNSYREADKHLWGKSFYLQLEYDIDNCFELNAT